MVLSLFLIGGLNAQNQQPQRPNMQEWAKKQMEALTKELSLTKDQVTKVEAINKEFDTKREAAFKNAGDDRQGMREKMTAIEKEKTAKIEKILTPDQVKKYKAYLEKLAAERKNRMGQGGPGGPGGQGGQRQK